MKVKFYCYLCLIYLTNISILSATELEVGFDSKYVSEGRENLPNGGIIWTLLSHELNHNFSLSAAYGFAESSSVDYDEFALTIKYADSVGLLDYYGSFTRLEFFENDESDNEVELGGAWAGFEFFTPTLDLVYSAEAEGAFVEVGVNRDIPINNKFGVSLYGKLAFDFGYASKGNDGHNHANIGASLNYQIYQSLILSTSLEHNVGGSFIKRESNGEKNQTWVGFHFIFSF